MVDETCEVGVFPFLISCLFYEEKGETQWKGWQKILDSYWSFVQPKELAIWLRNLS